MYSCKNEEPKISNPSPIGEDHKHYIEFFNAELQDMDQKENLEYNLKYGAENNGHKCYYLAGSALDDASAPNESMDLNEFKVYFHDTNGDNSKLTEKIILTESRDNYEKPEVIEFGSSPPYAVQGSLGCGPGILYAEEKEDSVNKKKVKGKRLVTLKISEQEEYLPLPLAIHDHDHDNDDDASHGEEFTLETFYYKLELKDKRALEKHLDTLNNFVVALDKEAKFSKKDTIIMGRKITTYNQFCLVPYKKLTNGNVNIKDIDAICFKN
jgi:hypothetical protein